MKKAAAGVFYACCGLFVCFLRSIPASDQKRSGCVFHFILPSAGSGFRHQFFMKERSDAEIPSMSETYRSARMCSSYFSRRAVIKAIIGEA